ncbi:integrase, catalytic region, zinc finger, CCHC-type containing protein [Tanacetum coccineum]
MRDSIFKGPYKMKDIPDPNNESETIPEASSKMSKSDKEQYFADIRVMNYILQGIPNDIYNFVDACTDAKQMWARIKGLMQGSDITITQRYSTPTNNRLRTSSNTRNQAMIQDGRVDNQRKNVGYVRNGNMNAGRHNLNQATITRNGLVQSIEEYDQNVQRNIKTDSTMGKTNVQCYNYNEKGHYARKYPKPKVRDAKYFREQMLLATKDEARVHLDDEENDFMLDDAYGDNTLEEQNAAVIMMAHI